MANNRSQNDNELHFLFFPFMAQGHLIPSIDMAKLFASRGHRSTIITTSNHSHFITQTLTEHLASRIAVASIKIPCSEVGLPEGIESLHETKTFEDQQKLFKATWLLAPQLEELMRTHHPDCLIADMFFPWATDLSAGLGVPRLVFHGTSYFALCTDLSLSLHSPHEKVSSDSEPFKIPQLPHEIFFTREKLPDYAKERDSELRGIEFSKIYYAMLEKDRTSYGVIMNSFHELEHAYAECYTKVLGVKRAWHIGPLFLYSEMNRDHECLKWLDAKPTDSVVYVCFGSLSNLSDEQLMEIAAGLEASGKDFVWVVKKEWLFEGFEERVEGKGLVIRGWAPQREILEHRAVGGFVTHCGWNSMLEGVCGGVVMATWPLSAEQFFNEKLVSEVVRIGVEVGVKRWTRASGDFVSREVVERVVKRIMEAEEMRVKAKRLAGMARGAIEEGGSSSLSLNQLFQDLRSFRDSRS